MSASSAPLPTPEVARLRVFVVDDNADTANSFALVLNQLGHEVLVAYSGDAALETIGAFLPHVVLLDIVMPRLNGLKLAEAIRQDPVCRDALLVAVTGNTQAKVQTQAKEVGIDHFLLKPVAPQQLVAVLEDAKARLRRAANDTRHLDSEQTQAIRKNLLLVRQEQPMPAAEPAEPLGKSCPRPQ